MRWIIALALLLAPAVAVAGGAGVTAAITFVGKLLGGATYAAAFAAAAFTFVVSKASSMMSKDGSDQSSFGQGRTQTVRQEAAPRQIIYGETRVGGVYTFMRVTDDNRYLHMVITLSGHEVENIGDIYFDDDVILPDGGDIVSRYRGERDSGDVSVVNGRFQTPALLDGADIELEAFRIGTIVNVSGMANSANNGDHRITDIVRDDVAGEVRMSVETTLVDETETAATFHSDYVKINKHLGATDQAADSDLVRLVDDWTTDHRQRECAYVYLRIRWNRDKWPTGIPNLSAVIKGKNDIYDPRTDTTGYSENPALCISDFLTWERYGFGADYATEINEAELIASANVCDESVALAGGGAETRYTCNGAMSSGTKIAPNLNAIMGSMAGEVIWSGGQWYILAGYYRTPSVTFDESDLTGGISIVTGISRNQLFNSIKGTYVSPENRYIEAGFPAVTNSTYIEQDRNEQHWENIELPFTDSPSMAQRIAKIQLEQVRQQITVSMPVNLKGLRVKAGDVVKVTNARMGWTEKPFEITDWELALDSPDENPIFGVNLELRETASGVYDWNSGEETAVDLAPDTSLPDPFTVNPPQNVTVKSGTAQLYRKKDGTVVTRMRVDWEPSSDSFVREYEIQYKRSSDAEWQGAGKPEDEDIFWYVWDVEDDVDYDVRIRAINPFLVRSDWVTVTNHTVIGKTEPPSDVINLNAVQDGENVILGWRPITDLDRDGYEIRFGFADRSTWETANKLTDAERGTRSTNADIPPGNWRFFIKAIDTSGNYSVNATTSDLVVGTDYEALSDVTHEPDWTTGSLHNFEVFNDLLSPTTRYTAYYSTDEVDLGFDATDVRVWSSVDAALSVVTSVDDYGAITNDELTQSLDYGEVSGAVSSSDDYGELLRGVPVSNSRISYEIAYRNTGEQWGGTNESFEDYGAITASVTSTDNYGEITGAVESSEDWDTLMTWEEWTKGLVDARYIKQRVRVEGDDEQLFLIRGFRTVVDAEVRTERFKDQAIAIGGTTVNYSRRFHNVPAAVALVESNDGRYPVRESIDVDSITLRVHDGPTSDVGGTVDVTVTGV